MRPEIKQQQVNQYVNGALATFPNLSDCQLLSMTILHFSIPDNEAKVMVEKAKEIWSEKQNG